MYAPAPLRRRLALAWTPLALALLAPPASAASTLDGDAAQQSPQAEAFRACMRALESGSPRAVRGAYAAETRSRIERGLGGPGRDALVARMREQGKAGLASTVVRVAIEGGTATVTTAPSSAGGAAGQTVLVQEDGRWLCKTAPF